MCNAIKLGRNYICSLILFRIACPAAFASHVLTKALRTTEYISVPLG